MIQKFSCLHPTDALFQVAEMFGIVFIRLLFFFLDSPDSLLTYRIKCARMNIIT